MTGINRRSSFQLSFLRSVGDKTLVSSTSSNAVWSTMLPGEAYWDGFSRSLWPFSIADGVRRVYKRPRVKFPGHAGWPKRQYIAGRGWLNSFGAEFGAYRCSGSHERLSGHEAVLSHRLTWRGANGLEGTCNVAALSKRLSIPSILIGLQPSSDEWASYKVSCRVSSFGSSILLNGTCWCSATSIYSRRMKTPLVSTSSTP
jgi:hypothetical protein